MNIPETSATIVEMTGICKNYPGVQALNNARLRVKKGEVMALMGENGAGKSTLIKMLTGAEQLTAGQIKIDGQTITKMTPAISEKLGIACVYQNMVLAEHLTVAENIWMGAMPSKMGFVSGNQLYKMTDDILNKIGYGGIIYPSSRVKDLTASQQGMVAIVRAISRDARIIIFDEPTAVLAEREVEELFKVIRLLKERRLAIIYISHRMEEIFNICDTITVLKDGEFAGESTVKDIDENQLITMMVGREITKGNYDPTRNIGAELFRAEGITNDKVDNCTLSIREGEIVGLYGLVGAGRTELSRALFGRDRINKGSFYIRSDKVKIKSPRTAIDRGMSLIPEDRRRQGLALLLSVRDNINLPVYRRDSFYGFVDRNKESETTKTYIEKMRIKTPHESQKVKNLSGGNQQKVVVAKWLANRSSIFLMDEPTNGIDVGAKAEIYTLINQLAHEGSGILCVSSYMPELMDICDRIIVMNQGKITASVDRQDFNEEKLLALAIKTSV